MITESFIFLPTIGKKREQQLWNNGVTSWKDFLGTDTVKGITQQRKQALNDIIKLWNDNYVQKNHKFFYFNLPLREHFRLWELFKDDVLYIDIETTEYYGDITVVGCYDGEYTTTLVKGYNLTTENLRKVLDKYKLLITFNGSSFDIPLLEKFMGEKICIPHIDLRHVCAKVELKAPLKVVEQMLDIRREDHINGMKGEDAITLWYLWKSTRKDVYLEKLIAYNTEDIVNLEPIAEHAIPKLWHNIKNNK